MKNKIIWILSIASMCVAVTPAEANVKNGKEQAKEKKSKNHTPGCLCGGKPPQPPKFWFWFNWK
ncbi:MAG: hypothetical protein CMG60_06120 [Candidatus Marinimicrobia bacterium]|nr:hypothetical protein [Candidatus Neomarinimicrobiota bacterium]|tara:strand:+ start:3829 stop:4020 length:192 start_codon:yes stop_codon:yes gene_type:complete